MGSKGFPLWSLHKTPTDPCPPLPTNSAAVKQHDRGSLDATGLKSCQQLVKNIKTDLKKVRWNLSQRSNR